MTHIPRTDAELRSLQEYMSAHNGNPAGWQPPPRKRRKNEESQCQRDLIRWWHTACKGFGVHEWLLFSIPNGGARSVIAGQFMKMEGARKGVCDLMLAVPKGNNKPPLPWRISYDLGENPGRPLPHALFLELKTETGVLSAEQKTYHAILREQNYKVEVARSLDEAKKIISEYLS